MRRACALCQERPGDAEEGFCIVCSYVIDLLHEQLILSDLDDA